MTSDKDTSNCCTSVTIVVLMLYSSFLYRIAQLHRQAALMLSALARCLRKRKTHQQAIDVAYQTAVQAISLAVPAMSRSITKIYGLRDASQSKTRATKINGLCDASKSKTRATKIYGRSNASNSKTVHSGRLMRIVASVAAAFQ